jgi:hypothetical protein
MGAVLAFVLGAAPVALAMPEDGPGPRTISAPAEVAEDKSERGEALRQQLQGLRQQRQEQARQRLDENKLRVCEQRQTRIASIINRAIIRSERQLQLFDTIAERVKDFYVDKGYSLDGYDDLVAAADEAKADAQANLASLKDVKQFECDTDDPKGDVEAFKLALRSVNRDLRDCRTAVKDLIVGVKSASGTSDGDSQEASDE